MSNEKPISQELQAKIDALQDDKLKENILMVLSGPGIRKISNEQIFENMLEAHREVMAERAKWRQWRGDEVLAFVEHFKQELPDDYVDYLRQEREKNEIDSELSWRISQLLDRWIPGLDYRDCTRLLSKVRDHIQAQLLAERGG